MNNRKLLIALGGATGSGKTALAIDLAKQFPQLAVLSADSRQIYKRLDVGSAKVGTASTNTRLTGQPEPVWMERGIPQFLIDIAEPNTIFTLEEFQREAYRLITACWECGRIPFLVGGTGLYLQAVTEGYALSGQPNSTLRQQLTTYSLSELQQCLADLGGNITETDKQNPRRLIRAIERINSNQHEAPARPITTNTHTFVLEQPWEEQRDLAPDMVQERLDLGLIQETIDLIHTGVDKAWLKNTGLSYRLVIRMLDGDFPETELKEHMINEFRHLMRRQRTWFNRMPQAHKGDRGRITEMITELISPSQDDTAALQQ